jgi:hypothetical protein
MKSLCSLQKTPLLRNKSLSLSSVHLVETVRESEERLEWGLERTKHEYEKQYGPIEADYCFLTFVHSLQFRPTGEVTSYFAQVRTEVEQQGGSVIILINGWDGLTTD